MDFRQVTELARHARKIGADAVSSVLPFYYTYNLAEIKAYYEAISAASGAAHQEDRRRNQCCLVRNVCGPDSRRRI